MTQTLKNIRNISIIAQGGAGKTALVERMLFLAQEISRPGSRQDHNAALSGEPEEQEHGFDITPHVGHFTWKDVDVRIIDTPGYFSFLESTRGVLPGCDGALLIVSAVDGVKPETKRLWKMLLEEKVPTLAFMTQLDHPKANFEATLDDMKNTLSTHTTAVSFPVGMGESFLGVVDLIEQRGRSIKEDKVVDLDIPSELTEFVTEKRVTLIENIAEADDRIIEKYLNGEELSVNEIQEGLKYAVANRLVLPVFCGSGLNGFGVELLVESLLHYLPSPIERDAQKPFVGCDPTDQSRVIPRRTSQEDPFSAMVLKTSIDRFSGKLSVVRVVSGEISPNQEIYNSKQNTKQRTGNLYVLQGRQFVQIDKLGAGDIGALSKLEDTHTGDTLCDDRERVVYPVPKFSQPLVFWAVEAKGKEEKVGTGLMKLVDEDPTLHYYREPETGDNILAGMGQSHIDIAVERLKRKFSGEIELRAPLVPYRETIRKKTQAQGKLKKQTGGHGQFANCWLTVEPRDRGAGFEFVDQITGGIIPKQYIAPIEKGVREAMSKGSLGGFPVCDVKVTVVDGSFHKVDSSDYAFQVAGSLGFRAAFEEADPYLLEPIMEMQIMVPQENIGDIVKDIASRRGKVMSMTPFEDLHEIHAEIPYSEVLDYGNVLSSLTSGRARYVMHTSHYSEVPANLVSNVLKGSEQ